jgi:hypothetical protein
MTYSLLIYIFRVFSLSSPFILIRCDFSATDTCFCEDGEFGVLGFFSFLVVSEMVRVGTVEEHGAC